MHLTHDWLLPPANIQRAPYIPLPEQRVERRVLPSDEQRVMKFEDVPIILRITDAPPIMAAPNPMQRHFLKRPNKRIHNKPVTMYPAVFCQSRPLPHTV
jgi:hypothetical protein